MLLNEDREKCCGCGACMEADQKQHQVIGMDRDELHFYYGMHSVSDAVSDKWKEVCPYHSFKQLDVIDKEVYCTPQYAGNEILMKLACKILKQEGVVYGLTVDTDTLGIKNQRIESMEKLETLNSIYRIQSNTFVYREIEKDLINDKLVVVFDVPCVLEGLRLFLKKDYANLICVGIKCAGVASPLLWREYLEYRERRAGKRIEDVHIEQAHGQKVLSIKFLNGKQYKKNIKSDKFFKMIDTGTGIRTSCVKCDLRLNNQISDIEIDLEDGNIAVNTLKGKKILEEFLVDFEKVLEEKEVPVKARLFSEDEEAKIIKRLKTWPCRLFLNHYSKKS